MSRLFGPLRPLVRPMNAARSSLVGVTFNCTSHHASSSHSCARFQLPAWVHCTSQLTKYVSNRDCRDAKICG
ncbi:hypothetical protein CTI14_29610 [Methylobacterium radiotolerans]|nr:hypothetical protein CTI14_29610 [Methylobacterium radiotolerans]